MLCNNHIFKEIIKSLIAGFIGALFGATIIFTLIWLFSKNNKNIPPANMSYADLASVNLTVASITLTAVAIIIAIVSIIGFTQIKNSSVDAAQKQAECHVKENIQSYVKTEIKNLIDNGSLSKIIKESTSGLESPKATKDVVISTEDNDKEAGE